MWKETTLSPYYKVNEYGEVKRIEYESIDRLGRRTLMKEKKLKQRKDKSGYMRVTLVVGLEKPKFIPIHKLVAETFIDNPKNLPCVNHKDENPLNNSVENLEWCTIEYNNNYGHRNMNAQNTLAKRYGKKIKAIKDKKEYLFNSVGEAGKFLNLNRANIFSCLNGKLKTTGGYAFREVV